MFNKITRYTLATMLAILGAASLPVSAQISVGAKLGANLNQFSQPGTTIGFSAGAFASYRITSFLNVKVEPQYTLQGGARQTYYRDYSSLGGNVSSVEFINPNITMHNIEVPLLVELTLPEFAEENVIPKLIVGGSYTFMAQAIESRTERFIFTGTPTPPAVDVGYQHEDVTDNYTRNQFSAIVGLGVMFKTDKRDFQFDIRYRQGFSQVNLIKFPDAIQKTSSSSSIPANGVGGNLFTSTLSFNFSMTIFNF
ncbi:MAG: PorT family protein [Bacteroidetes bacterium]|nr:PorT family protein [Bacteroidota bacterium]